MKIQTNKYLFFARGGADKVPKAALLVNYLLVGSLLSAPLLFGFSTLNYTLRLDVIWKYRITFINGFLMTIVISIVSLITSTILGLLCALGRRSRLLPLQALTRIYIEVIRGTPLLVQILIFFYVIANSLGIHNRYFAAIIIMSLFAGAYIAEIIRAGIESIGSTQLETAKSIGLTRTQTYRLIVFPQVITRILPPLTGQCASLIKDSSLLSIIAIKEFTMAAREVNANSFSTLESYVPLAIGYLILTIPISIVSRQLEKRYRYET